MFLDLLSLMPLAIASLFLQSWRLSCRRRTAWIAWQANLVCGFLALWYGATTLRQIKTSYMVNASGAVAELARVKGGGVSVRVRTDETLTPWLVVRIYTQVSVGDQVALSYVSKTERVTSFSDFSEKPSSRKFFSDGTTLAYGFMLLGALQLLVTFWSRGDFEEQRAATARAGAAPQGAETTPARCYIEEGGGPSQG